MTNVSRRSSWRTIAMFVAVGPPVGGLVMGLALMSETAKAGLGLQDLGSLLTMALFGYVYGALPALATGWAAALASPYLTSDHLWIAISAALGTALSTAALWFVMFGGVLTAISGMVAAGAAASVTSAICALAVRPRRR